MRCLPLPREPEARSSDHSRWYRTRDEECLAKSAMVFGLDRDPTRAIQQSNHDPSATNPFRSGFHEGTIVLASFAGRRPVPTPHRCAAAARPQCPRHQFDRNTKLLACFDRRRVRHAWQRPSLPKGSESRLYSKQCHRVNRSHQDATQGSTHRHWTIRVHQSRWHRNEFQRTPEAAPAA